MPGNADMPIKGAKAFLYPLAIVVFVILLALRESDGFGYLFSIVPIVGGNTPFFTLAIMLAYAYVANGGRLSDIGLCWPNREGSKPALVGYILVAGVLIFAVRAGVSVGTTPLLDELGPRPDALERMAPLIGNLELLILLLPLMWLAVFGEELLFRGLLLNFFAKRFGGDRRAWIAAVFVSALLFGVGHFWQGPRGIIATGLGALVFGAGYYLCGRNLWPPVVAHAIGNSLGFISIYLSE